MSDRPLLWKFVLIGAVIVGSTLFSYPPEKRINLGLDLRGGAHILLQVDTDTAIAFERDRIQNGLGQRLKTEGITGTPVPVGNGAVELRGVDPSKRSEVREILDQYVQNWDKQELGGGVWRISMPLDYRAVVETEAVDRTLSVIRKRINALGVGEQIVQKAGLEGNRILMQLPGVEDPARIKDLIQEPSRLEWKEVTYPPGASGSWSPSPGPPATVEALFGRTLPEDTELYRQLETASDGSALEIWWPLKRVAVVAGADLRSAFRDADEWGNPAVSFELSQDAGRRFEAATRENLGRRMAILLGDAKSMEVLSVPTINGVIRDRGIIQGGFDIQSAEDLALNLRSGAIPTDISIIEERTVGPSLGRDSIRSGLTAGLAGFLGVMLFMLVYYRLAGVNAVVALALNVLIVFGILGALPLLFGDAGVRATLTLPGIAGLILTVGMAVDSNVLIFERIREELRIGKTVRSAVEQGFGKAFATILDCNVTTVVAAIFLSVYGTGPVRGFAVTLIIGLIASMFTAVFVSRQLFELILRRTRPEQTLSI